MSVSTTPAFIHHGSWDDETRKHPAVKFLEWHTKEVIDAKTWTKSPAECGLASDWTLQRSTGEVFEGAEKAWAAVQETYAPFKETVHDPQSLVVWETSDGWQMFGQANLWYSLQTPGDGSIKGPGGKQWDGMLPSAFKFTYRKGGQQGVELTRTEIYSDPSAAMKQMLKRGMLKPEQLMG